MIVINCSRKAVQSFFMETKVKQPFLISGEFTYDLYLEKYPGQAYLYINKVRSKELPGGSKYQIIEPTLLIYFDEICALFNDNTDIDIDDESYLPTSIKTNGKYVFQIDRVVTTYIVNTELGLDEIKKISDRIEHVFRMKIIPLLKQVRLID